MQFGPMAFRPFANDPEGLWRKRAAQQHTISNPDQGVMALIARMEMRRSMLAMIHADDDAEEDGNDRQMLNTRVGIKRTRTVAPAQAGACLTH